jgi:hypothetical protein
MQPPGKPQRICPHHGQPDRSEPPGPPTRASRSCPSQAAFNRAAKLSPYRRHRRQAASLPPPHERPAGQRACGRGHRRSPLDRKAGDEATPAPLASEYHPRCQFTSLPPPSLPSRIPAASHERASGQAGGATGHPARPEHRRRATPGPPGGLPSSALPS